MQPIQAFKSFRVTALGSVNRFGFGHSGGDYFFCLCQFALVRPLVSEMRQCSWFVVRGVACLAMIINDKWPAQPRSSTCLALPGFDRRAWLPLARRPAY